MKKIHDEFTHLRVSPQRKSRLRRKRDGLCLTCGKKRAKGSANFCAKHVKASRSHYRKKKAARQCVWCPSTAAPKSVFCARCRAKNRRRAKGH